METITFQCMACDNEFELKLAHLVERPNALKCPNCGSKPTTHRAQAFSQALDDFFSATAALHARFRFELTVDADDLPSPYSPTEGVDDGLGSLDDDDDDDEDEFEDDDFEEIDEDEDDDDEDDDDDDDFDDDDGEEDDEDEEDDDRRY